MKGLLSDVSRLDFSAGKMFFLIWLSFLLGTLGLRSGNALPEPVIIDFSVESGGIATLTYSYPVGSFTRVLRSSELGADEEWRQFSTSTQALSPGVLQSTFSLRNADRFSYQVTVE